MAPADDKGPEIPDKAYFRIGEVSRLVGVDTHVLRYWESEFSIIRPFRGKSKQRLYRRQAVATLLQVKCLLHEEGYTIAGAKKALAVPKTDSQTSETAASSQSASVTLSHTRSCKQGETGDILDTIRMELTALHQLLAGKTKP